MLQTILEKIPAKANLAAGISNPTRIEEKEI